MKRYFCTYFDSNYLPKGLVLNESLQKYTDDSYVLFVLCLDNKVIEYFEQHPTEGIHPISLKELEQFDKDLVGVKSSRTIVEYYFTITPCVLKYLLTKYPETDIINYLDSDIAFFHSPESIFRELGNDSVLIIPHNFSDKFKEHEKYGKYNVGLVSFRNDGDGIKCLEWWRERCIDWCFDRLEDKRFADQKYLDQWPELFAGVKVCCHKGMNLAAYNVDNYEISKKKTGYSVSGDPLIFYHYHNLVRYSSNFWVINFLEEKMNYYKDITSIYNFIISRLKYFERNTKASNEISNRFYKAKLKTVRQAINLFKKEIVFFHSIFLYRSISLQELIKQLGGIKRKLFGRNYRMSNR